MITLTNRIGHEQEAFSDGIFIATFNKNKVYIDKELSLDELKELNDKIQAFWGLNRAI